MGGHVSEMGRRHQDKPSDLVLLLRPEAFLSWLVRYTEKCVISHSEPWGVEKLATFQESSQIIFSLCLCEDPLVSFVLISHK